MSGQHLFNLRDKTAYVTGGLGLVGSAICRALASCGSTTIALDTEPSIRQSAFTDFEALPFDATNMERLEKNLDLLEAKHGPADIWVNSAYPFSDNYRLSRLETQTVTSWRENIDLQLNSYCLISNCIASRMASRGGGSIINMGSIYGLVSADFDMYQGTEMMLPPVYSAVKGGIINYTRYLASYYAKDSVRVNVICPGGVSNGQPSDFVEKYNERTPMGRMAEADEIGGPTVFLASDAASYVTGAVLAVDGGWTAI